MSDLIASEPSEQLGPTRSAPYDLKGDSETVKCPQEASCETTERGAVHPSGTDSALKAIRRKCIECTSNRKSVIRHCTAFDCELWYHRMGVMPATLLEKEPDLLDKDKVRALAFPGRRQRQEAQA